MATPHPRPMATVQDRHQEREQFQELKPLHLET